MKKSVTLAVVTAIAVGACAQPVPSDDAGGRAALREAAEAYHAAASVKDRAAVLGFYADDAMMVPPGAERVQGIAEVRNYRFGCIENPSVETRFETVNVEISSSGDVGWTLAIVEVTFQDSDGQ